jgi:hypothetical protein
MSPDRELWWNSWEGISIEKRRNAMRFKPTFSWKPDTRMQAEAIARFRKTGGLPRKGAKLIEDDSNDVLMLVGAREILSMRGTCLSP